MNSSKRSVGAVLALTFAALTWAAPAAGQTAQRFSIQLSALGVRLTGVQDEQLKFGGGGELQLRWNPSAFSIGIGGQTTRHQTERGGQSVTYKGGFVEPRLVLGALGDIVGIYGSGRLMSLDATLDILGIQRELKGWAVSGGGGLLIRLGGRVNGDLGLTVGKEFYDDGNPATSDATEGVTVVSRLGIAIGI